MTDDQLSKYYDYLKKAGADVAPTVESFQKTLSNPDNAQKYYGYLKDNGFDTAPSFESFQKTFGLVPMIDGMRTSTATQPQPKQQKLSDFLPKYENRSRGDIASLPGAKALPQTDEQLQKHFEDQRQAYTNTAKSMLKAKNMPDTPQNVQKQENTLRQMAQNGDIALSRDDKDNPIYARVPSWQESFVNGLLGKVNQWQEAADQRKVIDDNKKLGALLEEQNNAPVPDFKIGLADLARFAVNPSGAIQDVAEKNSDGMKSTSPTIGGNLAHMIGGLTPYFAAAAFPSTVPIAAESVFSGTAEKMKELYKQGKEQLLQQGYTEEQAREKAAEMAKNNAGLAALPGAILNTALMGGPTNPILAPAAKTFKEALSKMTLHSAKMGAYGGLAEGATQAIQGAQGYDVKDAWNKVIDAAGQWGLTTLALEGLGQLPNMPGYLRAAWKEYARQPEMKPLVDEAINNLPNGAEIRKSLNDYENARQKVDGIVPDEHISSYAGILEKQDKIKDQINELESRKASTPEVLHDKIDDQIKDLQEQSAGLDKQLASFKKSENPLDEEVDDMTGKKLGKEDEARGTVSDGNISKPIELNPEDTSQSPLNTEQNATTISEKQQQESNQQGGVSEHPGTESQRNAPAQSETNNSNSRVGGETPEVKGESIVTASGLNEAERQALIEKRKRETKSTDKTIQTNELLEKIDKFDNLAKGRLGKNSSEGLKMLNEINLKARELGLKFDQKSSKLKRGRVAVKPDFTHEGNLSIDESGTVLRDRPIEIQKAFNDAVDNGAFIDLPTLKGDKRMSADQIDGAIEDIHNGIPSVRANRYLDAFEKAYKEDRFPVSDNGREVGVPFNEFIGATKEHVGEPLSEQHINDWLNEQSKLTPDQDRILTDNIDNLIQEYGSEHQGEPTQKVEQSAATSQESNSEPAQPNNENIPTEANQTEPAPRESSNAKPIGAAARKLADKIREGKISKLGGFKTSTGFDAVWDGSLEVIAKALEKGADIADAIEQGLKYVRNTDWYKNLTDKQDFEANYRDHLEKENLRETGIKNEQTKQERAERGLDEVEVLTKRQFGDVYERAKSYADEHPQYAISLAESLAKRPRVITPEESATLIYSRMKLQNEHEQVETDLAKSLSDKDDTSATELLTRRAYLEEKLEINDEAARRTGYEQGLGLAIRRMMIKEDYSMSRLLTRARVAMGGEVVPEALRAKLEILSKELQEANEKAIKYEESLRQKDQELKFAKAKAEAQAELQRENKKNKRATTKAELKTERDSLIDQLKAIAKDQRSKLSANPIPLEMIPVLAKLTKNLVKEGIVTLDGVVDNIHEALKEVVEGVTKRDVRDAISGYGKTAQLSKNEIDVQLREIKRQGRLVSAYEDAAGLNGEPKRPERSGLQRDEPSEKVRELEKQVKKALKDNGLEIERKEADPEKAWKSALEAYKTRLKNQEEDLQTKIEKGDFTKEKRKPLTLDQEAIDLKANVERLKDKIDIEIRKKEAENRTKLEKSLDWFAKWRRGVLITGTPTLLKLQAAAMFRAIQTPIEEVIGGALSKLPVVSEIAKKAPREGGLNIDALAKHFSTFFGKETYKEAWTNKQSIIKTGKSKYDVAYGKKDKELPETNPVLKALEYYGNAHMALKYPAKKAEIELAIQKRMAHAMDNGEDVTSPLVQGKILTEALIDGNRAIFSQDNKFTKQFQANIAMLRNRGTTGKLAATGLKILFPITKIPTNYLGEVTSMAPGGGLLKAGIALSKGIESLTADEADYVMRQFKKQGIGFGLLALGYFGASSLGGFSRKDKNKKLNDVHPGDIKVFGEEVPHTFLHSPMMETMQAGATYRQIQDEYALKGKEGGGTHGVYQASVGVAKQSPFIGTTAQALDALLGGEIKLKKFSAEMLRSMLIPPDIQKAAQLMDKLPEGVTRKPKTVVDVLKMGIPGLREQVKTDLETLMDERRNPKHKTPQERATSRKEKYEKETERRKMADELGVKYIPPRR